ncbi:MAG: hypothetical protein LBJ73_02900 [Rickettsiales bacterium]|jgi:hypothetical protein|nr:hypothetical protein [Rickettsiales bacterium]
MKKLAFCCLLSVLCAVPVARADGPLVGTAGNNLTAFNGSMGAINNNDWNLMTNNRTAPAADFGNCNALILRCASPKCAAGGCLSMDVAYPIVSGCVMANESCKKHGDALIQTIAAQMVAASTAKANEQAAAAQAAAASAAAAQSAAQYQQMQSQMQEMQSQLSQQNAQQVESLQAALEEQKQIAARAAADAAAREAAARTAAVESTVASSVVQAAEMGVSADILARNQASGQIMDQLESAQVALKELKATMQEAFTYAGCDPNGNNCAGPKRVKMFKERANKFFDPYETVLDEVYDALIMAQSLGVDITDIYMMLNGSCNVWGKYMCQRCNEKSYDDGKVYGNEKEGQYYCEKYGDDAAASYFWTVAKTKAADGTWKVAPRQQYCTLMQMLTNNEEVQQNWLDMDAGSSGGIRVACASDALEGSVLFRNRKKQATIDMETLQRIIDQDAPSYTSRTGGDVGQLTRFCSIDDDDVAKLQLLVQKKSLTSTGGGWGKVCVADKSNQMYPKGVYAAAFASKTDFLYDCATWGKQAKDAAEADTSKQSETPEDKKKRVDEARKNMITACETEKTNREKACRQSDGIWEYSCKCPDGRDLENGRCLTLEEMEKKTKKAEENPLNFIDANSRETLNKLLKKN